MYLTLDHRNFLPEYDRYFKEAEMAKIIYDTYAHRGLVSDYDDICNITVTVFGQL